MDNARLEQLKKDLKWVDKSHNNIANLVPISKLDSVVRQCADLDDMSQREIYSHIGELKKHIFITNQRKESIVSVAEMIVEQWIALADAMEKDPNLKEDWDNMLLIMKMSQ